MLLTILGWIWIIAGVLFLLRPERLRDVLKKKGVRKIRRFFFGLTLALSILLISATWGMSGILPKIILVFGIIGIFKAIYFLKAKSAERLMEWFSNRPIMFFRLSAIGQIAFGLILLNA